VFNDGHVHYVVAVRVLIRAMPCRKYLATYVIPYIIAFLVPLRYNDLDMPIESVTDELLYEYRIDVGLWRSILLL
jgi:hypothetical protein